MRAAWRETCCALCSAWQRCSPQRGGGFVVPGVGVMQDLPSLVAGGDLTAGGFTGGKCQEHKTQRGVRFGLRKARGVNWHGQDLAEGLGSIPGKAISIRASPVGLLCRSEVPDPTAHPFPTRTMVSAFSRAAACGFLGQRKKNG